MHKRCARYGGFGGGETARLADEKISSPHIVGHLIGLRENTDGRIFFAAPPQTLIQSAVVSAHDDQSARRTSVCAQLKKADGAFDFSCPDASSRQENAGGIL